MTPEIKQRIQQIRQGKTPKGYKKTKDGIIPNEWNQHIINQCLRRIENPVVVEKDILYKQIGIRSHGKGLFYKESVTGEDLGNKAVYWIEPDCFIVNIVFAWEQAIGKTTDKEIGMIGSHRFPMYKPINNCLSIDYLIYYFLTKRGTDILEAASPGGAGRNRTLGQDRFLKSTIPLPLLPEQTAIAEILSTQDRVIELKEHLLAEKKRQKKYLMQQLLTGKMRLKGFKGEWKKCRLGEVCDIFSGGTPNTDVLEYWNGNIPWCTPTDISKASKYIEKTERYITELGLENSSAIMLPSNSILMCSRATIGPRSINKVPMTTNQGFKTIVCGKQISVEFMFYGIELCVKDFLRLSSGSTFLELSKTELEKYEMFLPPLPEQTAIAEILSTADREIELIGQSIKAEKRKKKSLMQLLLTGIVRVP